MLGACQLCTFSDLVRSYSWGTCKRQFHWLLLGLAGDSREDILLVSCVDGKTWFVGARGLWVSASRIFICSPASFVLTCAYFLLVQMFGFTILVNKSSVLLSGGRTHVEI